MSQIHLVTRQIWSVVLALAKYLPVWVIDKLVLIMCSLVFGGDTSEHGFTSEHGDTSEHGFRRPAMGPLSMKLQTGANPVMDVGAYGKIKHGEIQVLPAMKSVHGDVVEFADGKRHPFDAIVFATGYRSTTKQWLESDGGLIGGDGLAARRYPDHWKGEKGLYCAGLAKRGILGSCVEAELIAEDIANMLYHRRSLSGAGI
ncbi:probable indole-3-pyruvate monooxygenase YUCCA11 [Brachypodium distachyon]|nr:probable indole-3-pyruvate monooxygenase YUCCA11 [Brachypodium distachyon]|eukprot:XP_003565643.1 probable indole-3-pyruvate monooxygenase YUCCA11 [Brachypodium distachyon]